MPRMLSQRSLLVFLAAVLGCAATGPAWAQYGRRHGIREYPVAPLRILDTWGELGFQYNYFGERDKLEGSDEVRLSNHYFQEYLQYGAHGYVYHPRLMEFRVQAKIGLMQQIINRSGLPGEPSGTDVNDHVIDAYDLYAHFLKDYPISFSVFATRDERPVLELFTDQTLIEQWSYGAATHWANPYVPMDAQVTRTWTREWGFDSFTESQSDVFEYAARNNVSNWMRSELRFRYQEYNARFGSDERFGGIDNEYGTDTNSVDFVNSIYFTNDKRSYLTSTGRYYRQKSDPQGLETFNLQEQMVLQHTDSLRSYYQAGFQRTSLPGTHIDSSQAEAGIEHQLYKSLQSHLDLHARRTEFDSVKEDIVGGTGRIDYRKRTALGYLTTGYSRTLDHVDRKGSAAFQQVIDEPVTLSVSTPTFLANPDVTASSIVVTDLTNTITYLLNFDYEIVVSGNRTAIGIIPGSRLTDGQTVHVSYQVQFVSDIEYYADDQLFHIRHDFQKYVPGLSLYYRWHDLNHHDVPSDASGPLLTFTDQVAGMLYQWKQIRWTEEFRKYDSDFDGYEQTRSEIEGNHPLYSNLRWGWLAGLVHTHYPDEASNENQEDNFWFAGLHVGGPIATNGYWNVEARGQRETGRTDRTVYGVLAKLGYRWRQIRLESGARYERYDVFSSEQDRTQVFIQIARLF